MKKIQSILAILAMLFIAFVILLTSFQVAIYGDDEYGFYKKLYEKYHVADELNMEMDDVMEVTDYMMAYLIGEKEELSIVTDVDGKEQDFFNEQDRLHMADVKHLFLGGLKLRNILLIMAAIMIAVLVFMKTDLWQLLMKAYVRALVLFAGVVVLLGIGCGMDFTACFTLFHKMFFTNDLWLFDPATDYMIRMLPEEFFFCMVLRIGACFMIGLAALTLLLFGCKKIAQRKDA